MIKGSSRIRTASGSSRSLHLGLSNVISSKTAETYVLSSKCPKRKAKVHPRRPFRVADALGNCRRPSERIVPHHNASRELQYAILNQTWAERGELYERNVTARNR
jgi:hypothetical protein